MWLYIVLVCVWTAVCSARSGNIINGQAVDRPGKYPWQGSLQRFNQHVCGGSVIGTRWFLTASHCVDGIKAKQLSVMLGMHNQKSTRYGAPRRYKIDKIVMNDQYGIGAGTYPQDIALIKLAEDIEYNDYVNNITLDRSGDFNEESDCTISGWGYTEVGGLNSPDILQETDTEIITNKECTQNGRWGEEQIYPGIVCLYSGISGGCMGDSGGPLQCRNGDGEWHLVGLTSWGSETCSVDMPSIYTRVSCFVNWIDNVVGGGDGTDTESCVQPKEDPKPTGELGDCECPEGFACLEANNKERSCYKISGKRSNLEDARQTCMDIDSELIVLESDEEFEIIKSWLNGEMADNVPAAYYDLWTGAVCKANMARQDWPVNGECPGGFVWPSGDRADIPTNSTMWMAQRPRLYSVGSRPQPDAVAFYRRAGWHLDNRPSVYKQGLALCKTKPYVMDVGTPPPPTVPAPLCEDQNANCAVFNDAILTAGCTFSLKDICCSTCEAFNARQ